MAAKAYSEFDRLNWQVVVAREIDRELGEPPEDPFIGREIPESARLPEAIVTVKRALDLLKPLMSMEPGRS